MSSSSFPCKDCTKRYLGCHDRCEDYQSIKKNKLDERAVIMRQMKKDSDYSRFRRSCYLKSVRS